VFETDQLTEETNTQGTEPESSDASPGASTEQADAQAQSLVDLDSVEKFRFEGKEWTPADFRKSYMMQADYTRKTQAISEERKYFDNLQDDLERVKANPALLSQFRSVYPEKFHKFLGYVTQAQAAQAAGQNQGSGAQGSSTDPALLSRIEAMEKVSRDRESAAIDAELEAKFKGLSDKYKLADEDAVIARAEALLARGEKLTDSVWDRLWKADQERHEQRYKAHYSKQVSQQTSANRKGKDAASGGGIPGQAPKLPRTIKEASAHVLAELENQ